MISKLPLEIQVKLLAIVPFSSLKLVNSHFYILYNDLFYDKIINAFGEESIRLIIKVLPWLKTYIKTLDAFRFGCRNIIASRLKLRDTDEFESDLQDVCSSDSGYLNCMYVKDSWRYIYSLLRNKRLFAEYSDYKIDEPINYVYNHFVEINRTYLLSYVKSLWLAPGTYNLNIGLVIKHGSGLGTTKFEIKYENDSGEQSTQSFYPPTNINDILPKRQFCFLKIAEFDVPPTKNHDQNIPNKLRKVELVMEEIGLYLKSGFRIFFIDVSQPSLLFNDYDLLYYAVNETDYRYFINIPLKNFYKALNFVQESPDGYGEGDPKEIWDQYDHTFLQDYPSNNSKPSGNKNRQENSRLTKYANFFFNNKFKKRFFKFNTVYQRRQFVNRFGDFELDWDEYEEHSHSDDVSPISNDHMSGGLEKSKTKHKSCSYDCQGLKWKIPIIGEL
ncbi:uncharacterized protein PRCAT00006204001 [Priceomyces carsonii]|uniref:uncharacterized protein n=1 Tax=Priceomyces carsonii TaxID=28549 RepID=UPI002EDACCDF|nr:unnamed protein product [Priceomyces carsonii]